MQKEVECQKEKNSSLEHVLAEKLSSSGRTISIAESCTGGLLSHRITNIAGSSGYFIGSIVAYSNEVKTSILGVRKGLIDNYGAVSSEVALEMAKGAKKVFATDIALSVTGIAGPEGGTEHKKVGLAYIGFVIGDHSFVKRIDAKGGRSMNKMQFSQSALAELLKKL